MRHLRLTEEERQELEKLHKTSPNSVVRTRSFCLLLSDKGRSIVDISDITSIGRQTVSRLLTAWQQASTDNKFKTLSIASGRGAKVKLSKVKELLPQLVEQHNRNLAPILDILRKHHGINVCKPTLRNFLKGIGIQMETNETIT